MKRFLPVLCLLLALAAAVAAVEVPSSRRSREATADVRKHLDDELLVKDLRLGAPVFLRIFKESWELEVWVECDSTFAHFKTYEICSYSGTLGPKTRVGDLQAPEGFYFVTPSRLNPSSQFHLSFNLGYPNAYDRAHGCTGSALMVHGSCVSIGCFAMTDPRIEEIYTMVDAALRAGQPYVRVHIFPFRMTREGLRMEDDSPWVEFWANLYQGYAHFERTGRPPNVEVSAGKYVFGDS